MSFTEHIINDVMYMTAPNIRAVHAYTTRLGGVSRGIYESMNLGMSLGDDPENVKANYGLFCRALGIKEDDIVCSKQVHGAHVRVVTKADRGGLYISEACEADALITGDSGVALIVYTGDCAPVLLHDPVRNVVGAVHAGWRGTAADIAGNAVKRMTDEFGSVPANIRAAIGPCISGCCFETGQDVVCALRLSLGDAADGLFAKCGSKYMVDLKEANRRMLVRAGLRDITVSDECTSCLNEKYWSHRRTNGLRGSHAALIVAA